MRALQCMRLSSTQWQGVRAVVSPLASAMQRAGVYYAPVQHG